MDDFQRHKRCGDIYLPAFVSFIILGFSINAYVLYNKMNSYIIGDCILQNCSYTYNEIYCSCNVVTPAEYNDITAIKFIYETSNKDDADSRLTAYENSNIVCYIPKKLNRPIKFRLKYIEMFYASLLAIFVYVFALIVLFKESQQFTYAKYIKTNKIYRN